MSRTGREFERVVNALEVEDIDDEQPDYSYQPPQHEEPLYKHLRESREEIQKLKRSIGEWIKRAETAEARVVELEAK